MKKNNKRPIPVFVPFIQFGKQFVEMSRGIRMAFTGQVKCERCGTWIKRHEEILTINHFGLFGRIQESEEVCRECYNTEMDNRGIRNHL